MFARAIARHCGWWDDIDFDSRMLYVRNKENHAAKSRKNRDVPMAAELVTALKSLQKHRFKRDYVFTGGHLQGRPMKNNIGRDFAATVIRAGLVDSGGKARYSMHDLRRTYAIEMLKTGTEPQSVQKLLGHANIVTTMKYYASVTAERLRAVVDWRSRANVTV